jgi:hypothetical protein
MIAAQQTCGHLIPALVSGPGPGLAAAGRPSSPPFGVHHYYQYWANCFLPNCFLPSRHVGEAGGRGVGLGANSRWSARRRALRQRTLLEPCPGTFTLQRAWTVVSGGWRCPKAPHGAQLSWRSADRQQFTRLSSGRRLTLTRRSDRGRSPVPPQALGQALRQHLWASRTSAGLGAAVGLGRSKSRRGA